MNYRKILNDTSASGAWKKLKSLYETNIKGSPVAAFSKILNLDSFSTKNPQHDATEFDSIFSKLESSLGNPQSINIAHLKVYIMISLLPNQLASLKRDLDETLRKQPDIMDELLSFSYIRQRATLESSLIRNEDASFALQAR